MTATTRTSSRTEPRTASTGGPLTALRLEALPGAPALPATGLRRAR